jgi:hypothetical protein
LKDSNCKGRGLLGGNPTPKPENPFENPPSIQKSVPKVPLVVAELCQLGEPNVAALIGPTVLLITAKFYFEK